MNEAKPNTLDHRITFRVDDETWKAIDQLLDGQPKVRGRLSVLMRRLILEATSKSSKLLPP